MVTEACRRAGDPPPTFQPVYLSTRKMLACVESPLVRAAYLDAREVLTWAAVRGEADELQHPLARAMTGKVTFAVKEPPRLPRDSRAPLV